MIRSLRILQILSLLFLHQVVSAQQSWTLEDCINHALQNNIQLKRSELQERVSQKEFTQSTFELGPNLSGFYNHQLLNGTTFNQYTLKFESLKNQSGSLGLSSEITLFDGFYSINNRARLKYQLEAAKQQSEVLKNSVTLNVVAAYLQVLLESEMLNLAEEQYELSQKQLDKAEAELKLGKVSQADYLNLKAQSINQKALLTSARNRFKYYTLELAQLLEVNDVENFTIAIPSIMASDADVHSISFDAIHNDIAQHRPEIKKAEFMLKSAKKGLNMSYGLLSPRITLGYQLGSGYDQSAWYITPDSVFVQYPSYTYRQQLNDYIQHRIYFRVSIPIFQKLSNHLQISKSKIQLLDANYALEEAQKAVYKDVQSSLSDAQLSWDNYLAFSETVESYKELFDQTVNKYNLGMVNAIEVGIAQNNLVKAQADLLHAKYSYVLKLKILDFYRGVPITL